MPHNTLFVSHAHNHAHQSCPPVSCEHLPCTPVNCNVVVTWEWKCKSECLVEFTQSKVPVWRCMGGKCCLAGCELTLITWGPAAVSEHWGDIGSEMVCSSLVLFWITWCMNVVTAIIALDVLDCVWCGETGLCSEGTCVTGSTTCWCCLLQSGCGQKKMYGAMVYVRVQRCGRNKHEEKTIALFP